ncbi:GntR family transcriptional regulator [Pontiella sulfatireligans]|uniref:Maltose regulon regulatory protein MalI n=1 Tax=Pontiella sulfatireligans TaxID=2750658 RepID=A0A6C2UNX5_9BACT|nr:GntR family transcriptional regulator [Pontiella sulfatireligans]VGO21972.1 Maltose regulon regulatory protein MalI [Pontiella sulfatireligans]
MTNGSTQPNLAQKVLRHIYKQIQDGTLETGDKLPTNRVLAEELDVSIWTVQFAMKQLEAQGTVTCRRKTGTFLINPDAINCPRIQSGFIGLFTSELTTGFHTELLVELENEMMNQGKMVSINFTHFDPERELKLLRSLARQRLEALVYMPSPPAISSESYSKAISEWVDRYTEDGTLVLFADLCPPGLESRLISMDNPRSGTMLTNKLIEHGHKNIAFLGATHLATTQNRMKGYCNALKKAGLTINPDWHLVVRMLEAKDWEEHLEEEIRTLLSSNPELTGFAVCDQATAEALYNVLKETPNRKFSAEDSIASIFEESAPPFDALAWIQVPGKKMAQKACEILLKDHPADYEPGQVKIRPTFWAG